MNVRPSVYAKLSEMIEGDYLKDILKTLGWNDGFQIPVANEENKALEAEVARLTLTRLKVKTEAENVSQKCTALDTHLKFVTQECEQLQKLITAHKNQLDKENHFLHITAAEKNRLVNEIKETVKKTKNVKETIEEKKNVVKKNLEKIDKIKREAFWDEEALKAWEESLKKRDEDNNLLRKFSKEDEKKLFELEAKRAGLQVEYMQRQKTVAKMVNDLVNYESVLERTGKTIQSQLDERDALVSQWKDAVKVLHQRDDTISFLQDKLIEMAELLQNYENMRTNEEKVFAIQRNNNKEVERETEDLNAQHSRYQRDRDRLSQYVLLLQGELSSVKRQVTKTATALENERCKKKTIKNEIENKQADVVKIEKKIEKLKEKHAFLKVENMSVAERCKHLEKLIDFETRQHQIYLADGDRLSKSLFRFQSKLAEQVESSQNRELEIANLGNLVEGLQKMVKDAQASVIKKKEVIYNMEFKIDQLEEKISAIEKQKDTEDNEELYNRIKELEKECAEHTETRNTLQEQISRLQDEMRRLTNAITNDEGKLANLQNKLQNEKLDYAGGLKQLVTVKTACQEKQVEENMLILKLKQFDQSMKKEQTEIYNLQKMKLNLQQAMRERDLEIKSKQELLHVQKRNLEDDRGRLKSDVKGRQIKAAQLQGKYHMVTMSLGTDDEGQTLSVTHYKLKAAQDKYFLKQRGDTLDENIKKIEKEIVAMENTLRVVNLTNVAFKKSLSEVEESDADAQTMEALQKKFVDTTDTLRVLKKNLLAEKQEAKDLCKEMEELKDKRKELAISLSDLETEFNKLQKELEDKQEKVIRTGNLIRKIQSKLDVETMSKYDRDLEVQELAAANKNGLQKLCKISENYSELKPALSNLATDYDIKLPEVKFSATSLSELSLASLSSLTSSKSSHKTPSEGSSQSCQCSLPTSVSVASVVLSFDGNSKK